MKTNAIVSTNISFSLQKHPFSADISSDQIANTCRIVKVVVRLQQNMRQNNKNYRNPDHLKKQHSVRPLLCKKIH